MNATPPLNCFISFSAASSHHAAQLTELLHRMAWMDEVAAFASQA